MKPTKVPIGAEAGLDVADLEEARDQEPGGDEEHERHRDLGDEQHGAEAVAAPIGGRAAARVADRGGDRAHRRGERGQEAEREAGEERHAEGEGEHGRVEADPVGARDHVGADARDQAQAHPGESQTQHRAGEREDHALGQELRDDVPSPRSQRHPDADLFAPLREAREHEVRHVGAGDQQHGGDGAEQGGVGPPLVADQVLEQELGGQRRVRVDVRGVGLLVALLDDVHLGAHLFELDAGLETPEDVEEEAAVVDLLLIQERSLERPRGEELELGERERRHVGGQDADDLVRPAIEGERLADRVALAAEVRLPEAVGEDDDGRSAGLVFVGHERPPHGRLDAEHREEVPRHHERLDLLGVAQAGDRVGVADRHREVAEHLLALAQDLVARPGEAGLVDALLGGRGVDLDEPLGLLVRQRLQEDRLDEAEDGGVGADAEGERGDRDGGEPGRLLQRADGVAKRLHEASCLLLSVEAAASARRE